MRFSSPVEFGRALIRTRDLDPVYVSLYWAGLDRVELDRWLVAYWCFYHAGVASTIVDSSRGGDFGQILEVWATTPGIPRGRERRHWRGELARKTAVRLREKWGDPSRWVSVLVESDASLNEVRAQYGFGPWIAYKIADMLERLKLSTRELGIQAALYREPLEGARLVAKQYGLEPVEAVEFLRRELSDLSAPPRDDRPVSYQEVETVLCKWKAHLRGHYPVGIDSQELLRALGWRSGLTAEKLRRAAPVPTGVLA